MSAGLISRLIPLLLPLACLALLLCACLTLPCCWLLLLPSSPQPQGLSELGVASPTPQALALYLDPALLSFQLLLFQQWSHPLFAAACFSLWLRPIPFGQPVCFSPPASSLSFPRKLVPLFFLSVAFEQSFLQHQAQNTHERQICLGWMSWRL